MELRINKKVMAELEVGKNLSFYNTIATKASYAESVKIIDEKFETKFAEGLEVFKGISNRVKAKNDNFKKLSKEKQGILIMQEATTDAEKKAVVIESCKTVARLHQTVVVKLEIAKKGDNVIIGIYEGLMIANTNSELINYKPIASKRFELVKGQKTMKIEIELGQFKLNNTKTDITNYKYYDMVLSLLGDLQNNNRTGLKKIAQEHQAELDFTLATGVAHR